ncbi:MAG: adenosylhomocysteinase, partial [Parasporobacterium sp.]|nr:adenosylhomocysteinase [Parasporobacterium sp.]
EHASELKEKLINVPEEVDSMVAERKLMMLGRSIDVLTEEQREYLAL